MKSKHPVKKDYILYEPLINMFVQVFIIYIWILHNQENEHEPFKKRICRNEQIYTIYIQDQNLHLTFKIKKFLKLIL